MASRSPPEGRDPFAAFFYGRSGQARDRGGATLDFHTGRGQVTVAQLCACLTPVLSTDVLLVSDGAMAYRHCAARAGIMHEAVNVKAGVRARGAIHIQNVNGWHSRFKGRLGGFAGWAAGTSSIIPAGRGCSMRVA